MQSNLSANTLSSAARLSRPILLIGFLLGLFLSVAFLSGDEAGRVNLSYLLFIYVALPLFSVLISGISLFSRRGLNLARLLSEIPLWSKSQHAYIHKIRQLHIDKPWFFLQSQGAALAYALASLLTFMVLLLGTDINFVWRTTVLDTQQLFPLLEFIALPWWFWDAAQPSLELLQQTQDSRLNKTYANAGSFGQWWLFVLATQLVYSFLLRGLLLVVAKLWVNSLLRKAQKAASHLHVKSSIQDAQIVHSLSLVTTKLPPQYVLNNWASLSQSIVLQLALSPTKTINEGPIVLEQNEAQHSEKQIILVKAWEPPMGELQDYMEHNQGLVYPINYKQNTLLPPEPTHLAEWQRFIAKIPNWGVYQGPALGDNHA